MSLRSRLGTVISLVAAAAVAQEPVGQHGDRWHLGIMVSGEVYRTEITVRNENCEGEQDFEVTPDAEALKVLVLPSPPIVNDIAPGTSKDLPAAIDLRRTPAGGYERGTIFIRCLTCPAECKQTIRQLRLSFAIIDRLLNGPQAPVGRDPKPVGPGVGGPKVGNPAPPEPPPSPPSEDDSTAKLCGPDVTDAFFEATQRLDERLRRLPPTERQGDAWHAFRMRNVPWRLAGTATASCPRFFVCLATVRLFGQCVHTVVAQWMFDGLMMALSDPDEASRRLFEVQDPGASDDAKMHGAAMRAGLHMASLFTDSSLPRSEFLSPSQHAGVLAFGTIDEKDREALFAPYRECGSCPDKGGFAEDCTARPWKLMDGTVQEP